MAFLLLVAMKNYPVAMATDAGKRSLTQGIPPPKYVRIHDRNTKETCYKNRPISQVTVFSIVGHEEMTYKWLQSFLQMSANVFGILEYLPISSNTH